ncbi:hypothetical protein D9M68_743330 [compost metagenome]
MNKIKSFILVFALAFFSFLSAQASLPSDSLSVLKIREALLKENTTLNKLKLKKEKLDLEVGGLEKKIKTLNENAAKSAGESKKLASELAANPGDEKLSAKAKKAASRSFSDAKKAQRASDQLKNNLKQSKKLNAAIEKQSQKIEKMDQQLKFDIS